MLKTTEVKKVYKPRGLSREERSTIEKFLGRKLVDGETYIIPIDMLTEYSTEEVEAICDYCGKVNRHTKYKTYFRSINSFTKTYSCKECVPQKREAEAAKKQELGLLKEGDLHYWSFEENRKSALKSELSENIGKKSIYRSNINKAYYYHNANIAKDIEELGYDFEEEVLLHHSKNWWRNPVNVEKHFLNYMETVTKGLFPTQNDIYYNIKPLMPSYIYKYYGGIKGLKELIGYEEKDEVIMDIMGEQQKSNYEAIFANLLIALNINFRKETKIVPEKPYNTDFDLTNYCHLYGRFSSMHHVRLLVEIWGYKEDEQGFNKAYNERRKIKEEIYANNKDEIILISFEQEDFKGTYEEIGIRIYNKLSQYLFLEGEIDFKQIDLVPKGKDYLTKEKMEELCRFYSEDGITLPSSTELRSMNYTLYQNIIKRHGNIVNFADSIGMKVVGLPPGYWTKEQLFMAFDNMHINEGRYIKNIAEIRNNPLYKEKYGRLIDASYRNDNPGWKKVWEEYLQQNDLDS